MDDEVIAGPPPIKDLDSVLHDHQGGPPKPPRKPGQQSTPTKIHNSRAGFNPAGHSSEEEFDF